MFLMVSTDFFIINIFSNWSIIFFCYSVNKLLLCGQVPFVTLNHALLNRRVFRNLNIPFFPNSDGNMIVAS